MRSAYLNPKAHQVSISRKSHTTFFAISTFLTIMVSLSIFMTHQHYFLDLPAAILVCELVYFFIVKYEKKQNPTEKLFTNINVFMKFENGGKTCWGGR
jgi:Ca2+/Na+ antiporter